VDVVEHDDDRLVLSPHLEETPDRPEGLLGAPPSPAPSSLARFAAITSAWSSSATAAWMSSRTEDSSSKSAIPRASLIASTTGK
jgi:hypothetical protein